MMLFHAPGARLLASGCAVLALSAALVSAVHAREPRRTQQHATVGEIAPAPKTFEDIVLQLPPLIPAQRESKTSGAGAPAKASDARPNAETSSPTVSPEAQPLQEAKAQAAAALPQTSAPAVETAVPRAVIDQPALGQKPAPAELAEGSGAPAAVEAHAPAEAGAQTPSVTSQSPPLPEPHAEASPSEPLAEPELRGSGAAETDRPGVASETPQAPAAAIPELEPSPAVEPVKPVSEQLQNTLGAVEEEGSIFETWQLIVAAVALGGLLIVRRRRAGAASAREAKGAAAEPAAEPASNRIRAAVAFARSTWLKIAPALAARFARWREKIVTLRRKSAGEAAAAEPVAALAEAATAPKRLSRRNWAEIGAVLRAKIGPRKSSSSARERPSGASPDRGAAAGSLETDRWEQADQDVPELLEPGATSTRAIVMQARRKFRVAQG